MTKDERAALLEQSVLPILLGNGFAAHLLAVKIYLRYGITSFVCGSRKKPLDRLNPACGFYRLFRQTEDRLAAEQLLALADGYGDVLFVLVPTAEEDRRFMEAYASELESRFIFSDPRTIFAKLPFASASRA
ncbi:MAG: hypothetical protein IJX94_03590 [Clostridia bacterium]|nr:hypothetical protein [Clostridia bacterium]MBQ8331566.1 hypothetical protein [Clostridia bacterium]